MPAYLFDYIKSRLALLKLGWLTFFSYRLAYLVALAVVNESVTGFLIPMLPRLPVPNLNFGALGHYALLLFS